jgi:predicted metal-binding protein
LKNDDSPLSELESIFSTYDLVYKWIRPHEIVVSQWVRMKCVYGCPEYGQCASCLPNTPSVEECRAFFDEYTDIAVFRFNIHLDNPEDRHDKMKEITRKLLRLEKEVFLSGYVKAFLLPPDSCSLCNECVSSREDCKQPNLARPSPEALAMDVFSSVRNVSFPINVLKNYDERMNRYAFLLVR